MHPDGVDRFSQSNPLPSQSPRSMNDHDRSELCFQPRIATAVWKTRTGARSVARLVTGCFSGSGSKDSGAPPPQPLRQKAYASHAKFKLKRWPVCHVTLQPIRTYRGPTISHLYPLLHSTSAQSKRFSMFDLTWTRSRTVLIISHQKMHDMDG